MIPNSGYYYLDKGIAKGPVSLDVIVEFLRQGQLHALDSIFEEGDSKWRKVSEFETLTDLLQELQKTQNSETQWVLLVKKSEDKGKGFIQSGPFATSLLKERLNAGSIRYTDYIWKKGMKSWQKISELEEFAPPKKEIPLPPQDILFEAPPFPEVSKVDILKNVLKKSDLIQPVPEEIPEEAMPQAPEPQPMKAVVVPVAQQKKIPQKIIPQKKSSRKISLVLYPLVFVFSSLGIFALLSIKRTATVTSKPEPVFSSPAEEVVVKPTPSIAPQVVQSAKPLPPPVKPASYVKAQLVEPHSETAKLIIETDGTAPEIALSFLFSAEAGEVLEKRALHKTYRRTLVDGRGEFLLKTFKLPEGFLNLHIEITPTVFQNKIFFFGQQDAKFRDKIRHHKKEISFFYQSERMRLFTLASRLLTEVQEYESNKSLNALKSLVEAVRARDLKTEAQYDNLCLWSEWLNLRNLVQDLSQRLHQNEPVSAKEISEPLLKFKSRVQRLSLWR